MRIPTFPTLIRTLHRFSGFSTRVPHNQLRALRPFTRGTILKSMPTIPFLSNFFSTGSSPKMSYPVQKTDDEWRAVLSKGLYSRYSPDIRSILTLEQTSSESSESKGPKPLTLANLTSTHQRLVSTPAPAATPLCTPRTTSSSPAAVGQHTLITSPER